MIIVLHQDSSKYVADEAASRLLRAFSDKIEISLLAAENGASWPREPEWDDLLIVIYDGKDFPAPGNHFIELYLQKRGEFAQLLPVAIDSARPVPPPPAAGIKAIKFDASAVDPMERIVTRAGGMLGLRLQGRDSKIFISHRATDGANIAKQLHDHLIELGHRPFLDEARELDGEISILPGNKVQSEIDAALAGANLLLLIDTPSAPESKWIKHEVDTADGLLLPILPICFRIATDSKVGPRFRSLLDLQRWIPMVMPEDTSPTPLQATQMDLIVEGVEKYLCEIFRRKCRVPNIVEREFVTRGFAWKVLDKRLLMFESGKSHNIRLRTTVKSHCSLFDQIYSPAIIRFVDFLKANGRGNHSLFIYDGELIPPPQLEEIVNSHSEDIVILHHQELAALIGSSFTNLALGAP